MFEESRMKTKQKNTLGIVGCLIGFIALVTAFLSPQIAEAIDPPAKPIEESAVDFALKLKAVAEAKMKGEEYQVEPVEKNPSAHLFTAVIAFGMIGTGCGLGSLIRGENKNISGGAMTLGITAAIVQWSLLIAGVIIFFILVALVLGALGIDFPSF
ncbi:MAG TPA: hypothetical protein DCX06_08930 [Opitutae bacterium]|nr:hypothetical protein [Opitutae bacterium]